MSVSEILLRRRANARSVSTSFLHYGSITYLISSFNYPNLLCFNFMQPLPSRVISPKIETAMKDSSGKNHQR